MSLTTKAVACGLSVALILFCKIEASGVQADATELKSNFLNALAVSSCDELANDHEIDDTGYYLMKIDSSDSPVYKYCDFEVYRDVSACDQLTVRHHIYKAGYYRYGRTSAERRHFRFCQPVFRGIYTCERLKHIHGVRDSGFYMFATKHPFRVYCNFTSGRAVTEVRHDRMKEISVAACTDRGCYKAMPLYDANREDLKHIVVNAVSCKQFIKKKCQGSLLADANGNHYAWWVSQNGEKMMYWGGTRRNGYCSCGAKGNCINNKYKCNCNQNSDNVLTSDEGYLTDKTKLPVREVRDGDTDGQNEYSWLTIGKLECEGQVPTGRMMKAGEQNKKRKD